MDYGQFKYQQAKKVKEAKKKQKQIVVKEVKLRPRIEPHDYEFKIDHAIKFLNHGDKVRFILQFKGREMAHKSLGMAVMHRVLADLKDYSLIEQDPKEEGRFLNMTLAPLPSSKRKKSVTDTSQDLTDEDISLSLMEGVDFDVDDEPDEEIENIPKEETEE